MSAELNGEPTNSRGTADPRRVGDAVHAAVVLGRGPRPGGAGGFGRVALVHRAAAGGVRDHQEGVGAHGPSHAHGFQQAQPVAGHRVLQGRRRPECPSIISYCRTLSLLRPRTTRPVWGSIRLNQRQPQTQRSRAYAPEQRPPPGVRPRTTRGSHRTTRVRVRGNR